MTDALVALYEKTTERAVEVYARQLEAGFCDDVARAYAAAYAIVFLEGYLEGFETGRLRERARLKALHDAACVHGPETQRWVMAIELGSEPDASLDPPESTLSN